MRYSQNGWTVYESSSGLWPFRWVTGRVRGGSVFTVLDYLAGRFHDEVEPIDRASSWGYANRPIRGSRFTSNHASGTAVDFNAPRHPLGKRGTFTPAQRAAIRRILNDLDGTVRWGGDYSGRADEMHFEVNASESEVSRVAARIVSGAIEVSKPEPVAPVERIPTPTGTLPAPLTPEPEDDDMTTRISNGGGHYLVNVGTGLFWGIPDVPTTTALGKVYADLPVTELTEHEFNLTRQACAATFERLHPGYRATFLPDRSVGYAPIGGVA